MHPAQAVGPTKMLPGEQDFATEELLNRLQPSPIIVTRDVFKKRGDLDLTRVFLGPELVAPVPQKSSLEGWKQKKKVPRVSLMPQHGGVVST